MASGKVMAYLNYSNILKIVKSVRFFWNGLRRNRAHDFSEKAIVIGAATAFAGQADFCGKVLQDIEGDMAHHGHVLGGMVFANAAVVLPERYVQAPMQ